MSNGCAVLLGVDGRNTWARRLRDLISLHLSDLGGDDAVSEAERSIVRRVATLTVELERMEAGFATAGEAEPEQIDLYQRTANSLRRLLESVGLKRVPRDVTPSLHDYLAAKAKADDEVAA
jgi:NAD/NADP transhydrogenase alpha subunit